MRWRADRVVLGERYLGVNPKLPSVMDLADVSAVPDLLQIADLTDIGPVVTWIKKHWTKSAA